MLREARSSRSEKPTYDTTMVLPCGASTVNCPSISVMAPLLVPFTFTVAPTMGSPASSFTTPLMVLPGPEGWETAASLRSEMTMEWDETTTKLNLRPFKASLSTRSTGALVHWMVTSERLSINSLR